MKHVYPHLEGGHIKPVVHQSFPLSEVGEAHALMHSGQHMGKIVLEI